MCPPSWLPSVTALWQLSPPQLGRGFFGAKSETVWGELNNQTSSARGGASRMLSKRVSTTRTLQQVELKFGQQWKYVELLSNRSY